MNSEGFERRKENLRDFYGQLLDLSRHAESLRQLSELIEILVFVEVLGITRGEDRYLEGERRVSGLNFI